MRCHIYIVSLVYMMLQHGIDQAQEDSICACTNIRGFLLTLIVKYMFIVNPKAYYIRSNSPMLTSKVEVAVSKKVVYHAEESDAFMKITNMSIELAFVLLQFTLKSYKKIIVLS